MKDSNRVLAFAVLAAMVVLQASPAFAQFTQAGAQATNWVVQMVTPLAGLAVCVVGVLCLTGRVAWPWFVGGVIGIGLIFGRDQVVQMFRSWLSV